MEIKSFSQQSGFQMIIEKQKPITMANHNKRKQHNKSTENSKQKHVTGVKRGKTRATKWRFIVGFGFASDWL